MTKESALNRIIADIEDRFELRYSEYVQYHLKSSIKCYLNSKEIAEYDLTEFNNGFYLGKWRNGKRNGFGVQYWYHCDGDSSDSSFYIGYWQDDQKYDEEGVFCYSNSQIYCGGFVNDKKEGEGHLVRARLDIVADFKNDNIVKVIYSENDFTYNGRHFKNTIGRESDSGSSCLGFIIMVAIIWGCFKYCGNCSSSSDSHYRTEVCEATTTYICIARKSLKVRISPSTSARQMGSIMSGEEVEVYNIADGFAKIRFNGDIGYASSKYLKQK